MTSLQRLLIVHWVGMYLSSASYDNVTMTDLDGKFVFMNNQSIYAKSAVTNSIFGVVIAFLVLLVKTRVFLIAPFACFTITCVLVSVVGMMVMLGWELGTMESILVGILLSGLSVDYVIHLAHEYESFDESLAVTMNLSMTTQENGSQIYSTSWAPVCSLEC
jgi:Predicted exporters of the RND superfamily